jgi:hypothetical protein
VEGAGVELAVACDACDSTSGVSNSIVGVREELDEVDLPNWSFDWPLGGMVASLIGCQEEL